MRLAISSIGFEMNERRKSIASLQGWLNTERAFGKARSNSFFQYLQYRRRDSGSSRAPLVLSVGQKLAAADIPLFFTLFLPAFPPRLTRADQPISLLCCAACERPQDPKWFRRLSRTTATKTELPEGGAALAVVGRHIGTLRHLVVVLGVDDTVERTVKFDMHRQTRARALHF